jgi:hypothetical protein
MRPLSLIELIYLSNTLKDVRIVSTLTKEFPMKKIVALAFVAVACSTSAVAQSTGNLYGEAAYAVVTAKDTSATNNVGTFNPTAGRFTLGTVVRENLAVEGFLMQGLSGDSKRVLGTNVEVKLNTGYGVAVRPFVNLSNEIELFGRVGTVRNEVEVAASAYGRSMSTSSKSTNTLYGAGVAYKINKDFSAVVDYTKLSNKDDTDASILAIGLRFNF